MTSNMKSNRLKKTLIAVMIAVAIPLTAYLSTSIYLGCRVYSLVESSFLSKGRDYESCAGQIGRINYQCLDYSCGNDEKWEVNYHSFPIVLHNFRTAKAKYQYTIKGDSIGGKDIPVTVHLERRNGKWYITGVSEPY